jgi:hypothetical protein
MPSPRPISSLVLAELYDSGDASFLDRIAEHTGSFKPLLGLIEKWKKDSRPWARRLKFDFVLRKKLTWDNRVVFKRLFKQAWADRDHELMGAFMVVLDRSIRRVRVKHHRYVNRTVETTEVLRVPAKRDQWPFSTVTRHYLRRRAWRYFRRLGFLDGPAYIAAMGMTLPRYRDEDMRAGENLMDNWGLMHACFGKSPVLAFSARHTNLSANGSLAELSAAPMFERHWAKPEAMATLLEILLAAQCRAVRVWAIEILRRLHAASLSRIDPAMLLKLIDHVDVDVASFAAELLNNAQTVASFPMLTWMGLLSTRNPGVVAMIVEAFRNHVSFDRVTLAQAVELSTRVAVPVARVGMEILAAKLIRSDADLRELAGLSAAKCVALAGEIAQFGLSRLNVPKAYRLDEVIRFFDSNVKTLRGGAFVALADQSPADTDPAFWARLFESPYDDVRFELVRRLKLRGTLPGASTDATATLWQTVLLNIHRGGRAKLSALRQISDRVVAEPQSAKLLLPVLTIAIRSVRPPEARHGLAAIVQAVERIPSLADEVRMQLPELNLEPAGVGR